MKAYVTLVKVQQVELDVDDLVERFGSRARTQGFLKDYAVGNHADGGVVESVSVYVVKEPKPPKVRRGVGSW